MDIIIVGGFLGAGKTTLINGWLDEVETDSFCVVVNEAGDINLDVDDFQDVKDRVYDIHGGCVCCNMNTELIDVLEKIEEEGVELTILEPTGIADLGSLKRRIPSSFQVRIITLCDASVHHKFKDNFGEFYGKQLRDADRVYTNRGTVEGWEEKTPSLKEVLSMEGSKGEGLTGPDIGLHTTTLLDCHFADVKELEKYLKKIDRTYDLVRAKGEALLGEERIRFHFAGYHLTVEEAKGTENAVVLFTKEPIE